MPGLTDEKGDIQPDSTIENMRESNAGSATLAAAVVRRASIATPEHTARDVHASPGDGVS